MSIVSSRRDVDIMYHRDCFPTLSIHPGCEVFMMKLNRSFSESTLI